MEVIQTLLVIVIIVVSALLFVVGIQVVLIINDLRRAVKRVNTLLDDSIMGGGLLRPEKITKVFEMFRKKKKVETMGDS